MEWTYSVYTGFNYGICIALIVFMFFGVLIIFFTSETGKKFVNERIIGVDPPEWEGDEEETDKQESSPKVNDSLSRKSRWRTCIGILFCILGIMTLSITIVLIFQGCLLANVRLLPDDQCPDFPMDCFIFTHSNLSTISESVSFQCKPTNKTQFPSGLTEPVATCFGWIILYQTAKTILDQLGVCTGLLGLFTTILAIIVYLGRSIKTLIVCIAMILCSAATVILLVAFQWSFAPLSYAVLSLGIALGIFGLILFCISPKPKQTKAASPAAPLNHRPSQSRVQSVAIQPAPKPQTAMPHRTQVVPSRSSKVHP